MRDANAVASYVSTWGNYAPFYVLVCQSSHCNKCRTSPVFSCSCRAIVLVRPVFSTEYVVVRHVEIFTVSTVIFYCRWSLVSGLTSLSSVNVQLTKVVLTERPPPPKPSAASTASFIYRSPFLVAAMGRSEEFDLYLEFLIKIVYSKYL
jgi:hypothetical protein